MDAKKTSGRCPDRAQRVDRLRGTVCGDLQVGMIGQVQNSLHRTVEYAPPSPLIRSPQSVRIDQVMRYCVWMFGKDLPWMRKRRGVRPRSRPRTALRR